MNQSENSSPTAPKADPRHDPADAKPVTENQGTEQMAFFETTSVPAADGSEASAALAEETVEAAPGASNDTATPAQTMQFPESLAQRLIAARDARGWSQRDSRVPGLLQVERSGIPTPNVDPGKVQAVLDADRQ